MSSNKCGHCGAPTTDICNQNGCGFLESGNGAHVVERQPVVLPNKMVPSGYDSEGSIGLRQGWNDFHDAMSKLGPLYTAPPELAELQATIAQLTADYRELSVENDRLLDVACTAEAEVERLKGGQGEPVAFIVGNRYRTQAGETVRFVRVHNEGTDYETMEDEQGINRYTRRDFGRVTGSDHEYSDPRNTPPLYASQPAPVSAELVHLLEHAKIYARGPFLDEINACLDKVKELNQ